MMKARKWFLARLFLVLFIAAAFAPAQAVEQEISFRLEVPEGLLARLDPALRSTSRTETVSKVKGGPALLILVGAASAVAIADTAHQIYRDMTTGGLVIDTRNDELVLESDPALSSKTVVVQTDSGVCFFEEAPLALEIFRTIVGQVSEGSARGALLQDGC